MTVILSLENKNWDAPHCDQRYETLVLTTPQPEFYLPFGFRIVEEHIFKVKCDSTGGTDGLRTLNFADIKDFTLLHRLLEILARIPQPIEEVVIYFSPELLDVKDVQAFPYAFEETVLMVRGTFAAEGEKFMLPRSARC
jgi:hypothetical protein